MFTEMICAYIIFAGKPEGKKSLARPRGRWEDNIKIDFKGKGWEREIERSRKKHCH
jgi:hypothetical protein